MSLVIYTLSDSYEWDRKVRSFENYDIYWLSGYVRAFELHGDGEPLLISYEDQDVRGINVVMKRDIAVDEHFIHRIPEKKYYDFSTPYGYGGWIIEGESKESLFLEYEKWCIDNDIISEFVRFHPILKNHTLSTGYYNIIPLGNTISMDLSSPDIIWENITSKNRNMIRKSIKNGVKIYTSRSPEIFEKFKEIYDLTMDRDNADEYYYFNFNFYESILNDLSENAQVFYAVYENKIIATSIMLSCNGKMNYHLSGSLKEYSNLAPTNQILYKAALWGCENGCKTLYLGGGVGSGEDNLFKFKKAFYRKEDLNRFYIGNKIYNLEKYNELLGKRGNIESDFFPKYRAE